MGGGGGGSGHTQHDSCPMTHLCDVVAHETEQGILGGAACCLPGCRSAASRGARRLPVQGSIQKHSKTYHKLVPLACGCCCHKVPWPPDGTPCMAWNTGVARGGGSKARWDSAHLHLRRLELLALLDGGVIELDHVLLQQCEPAPKEKQGTAVHLACNRAIAGRERAGGGGGGWSAWSYALVPLGA
jgi:hypothetical protein